MLATSLRSMSGSPCKTSTLPNGLQARPVLCVACHILTVFTNMTEDIFVTHLSQSNLAPVTVGEEILKSMKTGTQETIGLPKVCSFLPSSASAVLNTPF